MGTISIFSMPLLLLPCDRHTIDGNSASGLEKKTRLNHAVDRDRVDLHSDNSSVKTPQKFKKCALCMPCVKNAATSRKTISAATARVSECPRQQYENVKQGST